MPPRPCKTAGCAGPTHASYPFCPDCMRALRQAGLCKWCGEAPATASSQYCNACKRAITESDRDFAARRGEPYQGRYRAPEARENTKETKSGRD